MSFTSESKRASHPCLHEVTNLCTDWLRWSRRLLIVFLIVAFYISGLTDDSAERRARICNWKSKCLHVNCADGVRSIQTKFYTSLLKGKVGNLPEEGGRERKRGTGDGMEEWGQMRVKWRGWKKGRKEVERVEGGNRVKEGNGRRVVRAA